MTDMPYGEMGRWLRAVRLRNRQKCVGILQILGWQLLTKYVNGGLGKAVILYPIIYGESKSIKAMASSLLSMWAEYSYVFGHKYSRTKQQLDVADVICLHYSYIGKELDRISWPGKLVKVPSVVNYDLCENKLTKRIVKSLRNTDVPIHSFWFHGSIGSGEVKQGWSDMDSLVILSSKALLSSEYLKKIRKKLINMRKYMVDMWPYQMHGHFVLAEIDFNSLPSCMFPSGLFKYASCVFSKKQIFKIYERADKEMAMNLLWRDGVADLTQFSRLKRWNTLDKVAFLHRVYFLPCLVAQVCDSPCFKRNAFSRLQDFFTPEEADEILKVCEIWEHWNEPRFRTRVIARITTIARYNPILYQKLSLNLGKYLSWLENARSINFNERANKMSVVAQSVWDRVVKLDQVNI
ncbi:MAG: nucleotidyltransferase domain-containing protein [Coxiellaceae bacterium]|nr:nucleotidyltransferase domain-containing protein [Coxiellaceae bacterium]